MDLLRWLFDVDSFNPRNFCGIGWQDTIYLQAIHQISDILIFIAYLAIPSFLWWFGRHNQRNPFPTVLNLFILFILTCGFTHLLSVGMFYYPWYRFDALIKVICAIISVITIPALYKVIPKALNMRFEEEYDEQKILRKKAEEELRESNKELERFAYIASHDLQEPSRMVSGFLSLLNKEYKERIPEEGQEYIQICIDASKRMNSMVAGLLEFSRVSQTLNLQKCSLKDCLEKAKENISLKISEINAVINFKGEDIEIKADSNMIIMLFQNIMMNALKYNQSKPPVVDIILGPDEEFVTISVKDNGIGIEEEYYDKIFEIFKRVNPEEYCGIGVGLAISKRIVEKHEGKIWVESELGSGSTFIVSLPR